MEKQKVKFTIKIKEFRESKNLTQYDVADYVGRQQTTVSNWELGLSFPNTKDLEKLCELLKCTPNQLLEIESVDTNKVLEENRKLKEALARELIAKELA